MRRGMRGVGRGGMCKAGNCCAAVRGGRPASTWPVAVGLALAGSISYGRAHGGSAPVGLELLVGVVRLGQAGGSSMRRQQAERPPSPKTVFTCTAARCCSLRWRCCPRSRRHRWPAGEQEARAGRRAGWRAAAGGSGRRQAALCWLPRREHSRHHSPRAPRAHAGCGARCGRRTPTRMPHRPLG